MIRDRNWWRIIKTLDSAIEEAESIAPIPPKHLKTMKKLINFGKDYVAEEIIYREVFSVRPWRLKRLERLKHHRNRLVVNRAARYSKIIGIEVKKQEDALKQRNYARSEKKGEETIWIKDVNVRLARYNAVFRYWPRVREQCAWAEISASRDFRSAKGPKGTRNTGNMMTLVMMENFVKFRGTMTKNIRANAEAERLNSFLRAAGDIQLIRLHVIQQARRAMYQYRGVGDFPARFCLMTARQYVAVNDDENAYKYYDKLCAPRTKFKQYAWRGFLGRGQIRERKKRYVTALSDYDTAFSRATNWWASCQCARAIIDLCLHSGKLKRPSHAKKIATRLFKRADDDKKRQDYAKGLLMKKKKK